MKMVFVVLTPDPHFPSLYRPEEDSLSWLPHHGSHGLRTCRFPFPLFSPSSFAFSAIYRDNGLRVTPYAREMLVEEAQYTQVGLTKPPVSLADGSQLKARRKRLGMVDVCAHCIQVLPSLEVLSFTIRLDLRRARSLEDGSPGAQSSPSLPLTLLPAP